VLQSSLGKTALGTCKIVHVYHSVVKAINLCSMTTTRFSRSKMDTELYESSFTWPRSLMFDIELTTADFRSRVVL